MRQVKRFLSLLLTVCLVLGLLPGAALAAGGGVSYTDVNETDWFYDAVRYATEKGMMTGTGGGAFSPGLDTTRGMLVTILHRLEGTPAASGAYFTDVPKGQWYTDAVAWASANGVVNGYAGGAFGPLDPVTREQTATILYRYTQYKGLDSASTGDLTVYPDYTQVSSYAMQPMSWAVGKGLISGTGSHTLAPKGGATRAETSAILMRYCENVVSPAPEPEPSSATCTVTFDYNYGGKGAYQTVQVPAGSTVEKPAAPSRSGYSFNGWYTQSSNGGKFDFSEKITADVTLYAQWSQQSSSGGGGGGGGGWTPTPTPVPTPAPTPTPVPSTTYTVSFDSTGGSAVTAQSVVSGSVAHRPASPTKLGYTFVDWYTDAALTTAYDFNKPVTGSFTLYAKWAEIDVTISIDTHAVDYEETDVRRTFTVTVSSTNTTVTEVKYNLKGTTKDETETLGTDKGTYTVDVLLQNGENTFTVSAATEDGSVVSEEVKVTYRSGAVFDEGWTAEEYEANGYPLVPVTGSDFSLINNIVRLTFTRGSTNEQREAFIQAHSDIFEAKVGEKSALRMMQVRLKAPLTDKTTLTQEEYNAILTTVAAYKDLDAIVVRAQVETYHPNMLGSFVSADPWDEGEDADWWLRYIDADDAWKYDDHYNSDFLGNMTLGVADNGLSDHVDLAGRIVGTLGENHPDTALDHGTHVTGIMAAIADNNEGMAGVLHNNSRVVFADIFSEGESFTTDSQILNGITDAAEAGAKVINLSVGIGGIEEGTASRAPRGDTDISDTSMTMGILLEEGLDFIVVQAAGNGDENNHGINYWNTGTFSYINRDNCYETFDSTVPEADRVTKDDIIGRILIVANLQSDGKLNESSNGVEGDEFGDLNIIAAPGTDILSTVRTNEYERWTGTSMAAPIVTSVCGLVWGTNRSLHGNTVVKMVMESTVGTAQTADGTTHTSGGMGVVNALRAVEKGIDSLPTHRTKVVDATNGRGISAQIVIKNEDGELVGNETGTYYSNADGSFTLPKLPVGWYTLTVSAEGYADNQVTCSVSSGAAYNASGDFSPVTVTIPDIPMSPGMDDDNYRIILRWGATPRDLDSHLVGIADTGSRTHVYYSQKDPSPHYANLDHDDTTSYGPETITITEMSKLRDVTYAVHDYTNRSSSSSTAMSKSGAYVMIYKGNTLLKRFDIPVNRGGTEWDVFAFDAAGNIIPINQLSYCSSPSSVLAGSAPALAGGPSEDEPELKDYEINGG